MVASLLRVLHSGPQNERLNTDQETRGSSFQPNTKFFQKIFRRTGRFTTQWVRLDFNTPPQFGQQATIVLPRKGHLLSRLYLITNYPRFSNLTIPALVNDQIYYSSNTIPTSNITVPRLAYSNVLNPSWINDIGHAIIQSAEIQIGGARIERLEAPLLEILDEFTTPLEKVSVVNRLLGRYESEYQTLSSYTDGVNIINNTSNYQIVPTSNAAYSYKNPISNSLTTATPLPFFFSRNDPAAALPVDAIQADEIRLQVNFRAFNSLIQNYSELVTSVKTIVNTTYTEEIIPPRTGIILCDSVDTIINISNVNTSTNISALKVSAENNTIVLGNRSNIYTSLDGGITFNNTSSNGFLHIAYGNGYWGVTRSSEGPPLYSSDGVNWIINSNLSNATINPQSLCYNYDSKYWLVGTQNTFLKLSNIYDSPFSSSSTPAFTTNKVIYANGQFMAGFNSSGNPYYSFDGSNWFETSNITNPGQPMMFSVSGIAYGANRWMVVGRKTTTSENGLYCSFDGSNFSSIPVSYSNLNSIQYLNSNWVITDAQGNNGTGAFYTSTDNTGSNWNLLYQSTNAIGDSGYFNFTYQPIIHSTITSVSYSNTYPQYNTSNASGTAEGSANFPLTLQSPSTLGDTYLLAEYIYLDAPEANRFRIADISLPITQHYPLPPIDTQGLPKTQFQVAAPNPVRDLFFYCQPWIAPAYNAHFLATKFLGPTAAANQPWWPDAQGLNPLYPAPLKPAFYPDSNDSEPITGIALTYEGRLVKFATENTALFRQILPSLEQKKAPWVNRYYYNIPFGVQHGLTPRTTPTGSVNYDKITRREVQLNFPVAADGSSPRLWVRPYVETYNILRIYGGRAGTLFGY